MTVSMTLYQLHITSCLTVINVSELLHSRRKLHSLLSHRREEHQNKYSLWQSYSYKGKKLKICLKYYLPHEENSLYI